MRRCGSDLSNLCKAGPRVLSTLLLQAQEAKAIPADLNPEMLAENLISSFQGALLRAKVKKSSEPLKDFMYLYFDRFLNQREKLE